MTNQFLFFYYSHEKHFFQMELHSNIALAVLTPLNSNNLDTLFNEVESKSISSAVTFITNAVVCLIFLLIKSWALYLLTTQLLSEKRKKKVWSVWLSACSKIYAHHLA